MWESRINNKGEIAMVEKIYIFGGKKHVFAAEQDFLMQPDWILQVKGAEAKEIWDKLSQEVDCEIDPDYNAMYEEWLKYYGITHTFTEL